MLNFKGWTVAKCLLINSPGENFAALVTLQGDASTLFKLFFDFSNIDYK